MPKKYTLEVIGKVGLTFVKADYIEVKHQTILFYLNTANTVYGSDTLVCAYPSAITIIQSVKEDVL